MTNPYALLMSALNERNTKRFENAMALLARYETDAVILKVEQKDVTSLFSDVFDAGYKALIQERFTYAGKWEALNEAERKLEQSLSHVYVHVVAGYLKRVTGAAAAAGAMRDVMLAYFTEIAPLAERVLALKAKIGKRPPAVTKTSIERDERDAKAMTCQCCARKILAETGKIAHHGYQRPGSGYQTASCEGALELPFEVSRDALGRMIANLKAYKARQEDWLVKVKAETTPLAFHWKDQSKKVNAWDKAIDRQSLVTRETFDAVLAEIADKRVIYAGRTDSFDYLKGYVITQTERDIEHVGRAIVYETGRYDGWVKTHNWSGEAWVAI